MSESSQDILILRGKNDRDQGGENDPICRECGDCAGEQCETYIFFHPEKNNKKEVTP
jgi:hypothetical protein